MMLYQPGEDISGDCLPRAQQKKKGAFWLDAVPNPAGEPRRIGILFPEGQLPNSPHSPDVLRAYYFYARDEKARPHLVPPWPMGW
jgi:hypothetical protein